MKVRCIKSNGFSLTEGKVYDVIDIKDGEYYTIMNDKDFEYDYSIGMFQEVKEKKVQNCVDCVHYLGAKECKLHSALSQISCLENNNCKNYEDKIKKEVKKVLEQSGHYKGDVEPFDVYKSMGIHEQFVIGNIIKYAMRAGKKAGQKNSDIKKIFDYALELCLYTGITEKEIREILEDRLGYYGKTKDND